MVSLLPLYALLLQFVATLVGGVLFTREFGLRLPLTALLALPLTFLAYQFLISLSAVRAVGRELRQQNNWEKTAHVGAHRLAPLTVEEPVLAFAEVVGV
jgi:hypothetical protein